MKKIITILLLLTCIGAVSQPLRKGSHVILIRNLANWKLQRIDEGSKISIFTKSGKTITAEVNLIRKDSIYLADTIIRLSDIDKLILWRFAFPGNPQITPDYDSKSGNKEFICPPDSVLRNDFRFNVYIHGLTRKLKNEILVKQNPLAYKNFLKWNVTKIAHLELGISYERVIAKKLSWETEVSGMLGIPGASYFTFSPLSYPYYNNDGISVTTYPKFYFKPRTYLSVVAMYRYLTAKQMRSDWPYKQVYGHLQDQFSNDFGLSIRIGYMRRHNRTVIDNYVGIGIKYIRLHCLDYGSYRYTDSNAIIWNHHDHSPDTHDVYLFWPVFNLGIKIGKAFGR